MADVKVISLGGSIIAPEGVDESFLRAFRESMLGYLDEDAGRRLIVVCGGGRICRDYQSAYRAVWPADAGSSRSADAQDWIGVAATRVNAELVRQIFAPHCPDAVVADPTAVTMFTGRILVAGGWKPGFSTDYDAVVLAERFGAGTVLNLSNIDRVYTADPRKDPAARPIERTTWAELLALIGQEWKPGLNAPFDPVAAKRARAAGLTCVVAAGRDVANTMAILTDRPYVGTTITP
jgi:uridylate kinase